MDTKQIILIIDDDEQTALMLSKRIIIHAKNFEIEIHTEPKSMMDFIEQKKPNLILLDYKMPGMSGIDCLKAIRKNYSRLEVPVIMLTADESSETIIGAFDEQVNDYVIKGAPVTVILSRIRTHLDVSQLIKSQESLKNLTQQVVHIKNHIEDVEKTLLEIKDHIDEKYFLTLNKPVKLLNQSFSFLAGSLLSINLSS